MSRVGKDPITLPKGVEIKQDGGTVAVKGSKGELTVALFEGITLAVDGDRVIVERAGEDRQLRSMHGTIRALVQNCVTGVTEGYVRKLEIVGVGYRAQVQGSKLVLNIGFCHPVEIEAPAGVSFNCPDATHIEVHGIDKQMVGETAAKIRSVRKPEPYKGKGIRYAGEYVRRKAGKSAK